MKRVIERNKLRIQKKQRAVLKREEHKSLLLQTKQRLQNEFKILPVDTKSKKVIKENIQKVKKALTVISVFNGIGAFSESLKQLGINFDMKMVCEINDAANATYYANNEKVEGRHIDDINVLLEVIEENLDLDILVMTPECQSFSPQGSRKGFGSVSGNLTKVAIELFQKVQPKVLILENVFAMTNHEKYIHTYKKPDGSTFETYEKLKKKKFEKSNLEYLGQRELNLKSKINLDFQNTIGKTFSTTEQLFLEKNGKNYNFYWQKMSPNDYGAPQHRQRLILVGIRKDIDNGFEFPQKKDLEFTVKDILEKDQSKIDQDLYFTDCKRLEPKNQKIRENQIHTYGNYPQIKFDTDSRVSYPYVAPAILTGNTNKFMIDGVVRKLTQSENAAIMGFGKSFKFVGDEKDINRQIGNTVSPYIYKPVIEQVIKYVDFEKEITLNSTKQKRKNRFKPSKVINDHISIEKKIANNPDEDYLNLSQERYEEYKSHLENGGTISMTIEKYATKEDKLNGNLEYKLIITINDLKPLGFRNKKQGVRRYRIIGSKEKLSKIGKRDVLIVRQGGKGKFEDKLDQVITDMDIKDKTLPSVIDGFFGGGALTLKNIDKFKFDRYIINDLEPLIAKTMLAVKKDYKKVQDIYQEVNQSYYDLISPELKNIKKDPNCETRIDPKLQEIRDKDRRYRDFYKSIGDKLNNTNLDIYTVAGYFIFFNNRSNNGVLRFKADKSIDTTCCDNSTTLRDKSHMIKHWSYLLNRNHVEILNKDIFEIFEDKTISKDSLIISDGPYVDVKENYNFDNSTKFQIRLKNELDKFSNVIYCNEDCENLYKYSLHSGFDNYLQFERNNKHGQKTKKDGGLEFLGYRSSKVVKSSSTPDCSNSTNYEPIKEKAAA